MSYRIARNIRTAAAVAILGTLVGIAPAAHAEQTAPADHHVAHVRVTHTEHTAPRRLVAELNNGAEYLLRPCHWEDSHGCYWDAGAMGNGRGWSFVSVHVRGRGECTLYLQHARRNYCTTERR